MTDPGPHENDPKPLRDLPGLGEFATLGTTIAVCVGLGTFLGILADNAWSVAPWGLLVGLALGAGVAVMSVVQLVRRWL